ncbi:MAG: hypothetical protein VX938_02055, partial [Myxococcota bacterium]|nr:hypothetical protein [Myxococcota bacterium]
MSAHHAQTLSADEVTIPEGHALQSLPRKLAIVGGVGLAASAGIGFMDPDHFYSSYLTSFMYWLSIGLGGLWVVLIHHAVRAGWSV